MIDGTTYTLETDFGYIYYIIDEDFDTPQITAVEVSEETE